MDGLFFPKQCGNTGILTVSAAGWLFDRRFSSPTLMVFRHGCFFCHGIHIVDIVFLTCMVSWMLWDASGDLEGTFRRPAGDRARMCRKAPEANTIELCFFISFGPNNFGVGLNFFTPLSSCLSLMALEFECPLPSGHPSHNLVSPHR